MAKYSENFGLELDYGNFNITLQKEEIEDELPPPLISCGQHVSVNSGTIKNSGRITYGLIIAMVLTFLCKIG